MKSLSLQNISIGKQILFLPLIAIAGLFAILILQYADMNTQSNFAKKTAARLDFGRQIRVFQAQIARLKLSEKKFFSTQTVDAARMHRNAMGSALSSLEDIKSAETAPAEFDKALVIEWHAQLVQYQDVYSDTARELATIGFSENVGLRGSMRNAIHIVERTIKGKNPSLMRDMLQIRRHEKDFIIRREEKFYSKWEQSIPIFLKNVANSNLSQVDRTVIKLSVRLYADSFRHLAKLTRDRVLDWYTADKISARLLKSISISATIQSTLLNGSIRDNYSAQSRAFMLLTGLTMLIFVSVAVAAGIVGQNLRTNLRLTINSMIKLAKGDTQIRIPGTEYSNEIGQMANALRIFRDTEKTKVWREIQLRASQDHTDNIIESLNESLFEVDPQGIITRANQASETLWGTKAEMLIGRKLIDLFSPKTKKTRESAGELAQLLFIQNQLAAMNLMSSNQVASLMELSQVPMLLIEKSGIISQVNMAIAGVLGYEKAELSGQNLEILIPEKVRKGHHNHLTNWFKQPEARHMLDGKGLIARHKDGHEIELSIGLAPIEIAGRTRVLCICAPQGKHLGLGSVAGSAACGLFNGIDLDPAVAIFATANGRGVLREDEIVTSDGSLVPVAVSGTLIEGAKGKPSGAIVTIHDITVQKLKSRKILQFKHVLDESSDQILMFWPDSYELFYLNGTACRLTGWDAKEYSAKTVMDFNPDFDPNNFSVIVEPLITGQKDQVIYERIEHRNEIPVEVSIEYVPTNQDSKAYFVAVIRDISERKIAETAKAEFLSTVSHELRTPLTSIKGALGIINSGVVCDLNDKLKNLVSIALTNSDRLMRLINDILDIEKISSGKMDFAIERMDISELIHEAIGANEGYAQIYGVAFKSKGINKPILVNGDGQRLMQVMSNLMSNAAKFSEKDQEIEISAKCKNNKVRVQVKDYGSGIPKSAQATIFDRFTQADSTDRRQKGGTGLGLSIAKMIVEAHGNDIAFDSVEGEGTAFYFDLDLIEGKKAASTQGSSKRANTACLKVTAPLLPPT